MNILLCNYEYPPLGGGGGVATALLAQELAKRHEVTVLTSKALGTPADSMVDGVRVVRVPVFFRKQKAAANLLSLQMYVVMAIRKGQELLQDNHYDVINTHFVLPTGPVGDALARIDGVPNVVSVHGGDLYDPSKWLSPHRHYMFRVWIERLLNRADRVVGQSTDTLNNIGKFYVNAVTAAKTSCIPLGIKLPKVEPARRADYGFEPDEVLLVSVGRLVMRKAVDQLIGMMGDLRDRKARLLVIGSGPQERELMKRAADAGLQDRVRFMGYVEEAEKFRLLEMSDIYVSSSQHEGFGIVFLEAMACGLPVVCYNHGGQLDFLADGVTGRIVRLNDAHGLAAACRSLIADPGLRDRMAVENRRRAADLSIERTADRYESVFHEAIASRTRKTA